MNCGRQIADSDYSIVYVHDKRVSLSLDIGWFRKAHGMFGRKYGFHFVVNGARTPFLQIQKKHEAHIRCRAANFAEIRLVGLGPLRSEQKILVFFSFVFELLQFLLRKKVVYLPSIEALDRYVDRDQMMLPADFDRLAATFLLFLN